MEHCIATVSLLLHSCLLAEVHLNGVKGFRNLILHKLSFKGMCSKGNMTW